MEQLAGFPYFRFEVAKDGVAVDPGAQERIAQHFAVHQVSDLFILSHGWNNDMAEAQALYQRFFTGVRALLAAGRPELAGCSFAVVGVFWPSKKFADDELTAGGAASLADGAAALLRQQLDELRDAFDHPDAAGILHEAQALLPQLEHSMAAQERFARLVRSLPQQGAALQVGAGEDASDRFFAMDARDLMEALALPVGMPVETPGTGDGGGAAGFNLFSPVITAARNLLNLTTYYQMKARAGLVGSTAVTDLVLALRQRAPATRLHLAGHSFGARLVTALASGAAGRPPHRFASMTLMQAAFSHNGFADQSAPAGAFRNVVQEKRVIGPILVTHSTRDRAVGLAYPLASRLAGQNASALGDANDPFGGLGRNGAQRTTGAIGLKLPLAPGVGLQAGGLYNLDADNVIADHSDICKPEVFEAMLRAVAVTVPR